MPYFASSAEWFEQSALLLKARPATTRIVSKYSILKQKPAETPKRGAVDSGPTTDNAPAGPKAALTLKTYDPASGVCLKYQTNKAAEVGRLVASLEKLARTMAALPDVTEDVTMPHAPTEQGTGTNTPNPETAAKMDAKAAQGGGGGKKKKKGKK